MNPSDHHQQQEQEQNGHNDIPTQLPVQNNGLLKKRQRRRYATFQNDEDHDDDHDEEDHDDDDNHNNDTNTYDYYNSSDSDDDDGNNNNLKRQKQRNDNLYGSFLHDDDDDSNDDNDRRRKGKRKMNHTNTTSYIPNAPPIFVSSSTTSKNNYQNDKKDDNNNNNIKNNDNNNKERDTMNDTKDDMNRSIQKNDPSESKLPIPMIPSVQPLRSTITSTTTNQHLDTNENENQSSTTTTNTATTDVQQQEQQQKLDDANERFYALLQQGQSKQRNNNKNNNSNNNNLSSSSRYTSYNDGTSNNTQQKSVKAPIRNTTQQQQQQQQQYGSSISSSFGPKIGTWEKHTKGIGMKLLTKMGYSGTGGLIAGTKRRRIQQQTSTTSTTTQDESQQHQHDNNNNDSKHTINATNQEDEEDEEDVEPTTIRVGIAAPIQVKVRPTNLGLGYGNYKESTSIKYNQHNIIKPPSNSTNQKQHQQQHENNNNHDNIEMMSIMQQQLWKRYKKNEQINHRQNIIPYQQLLQNKESEDEEEEDNDANNDSSKPSETKPITILDLRGPTPMTVTPMELSSNNNNIITNQKNDTINSNHNQSLLGEELLQNVIQLCNSYANQVQMKQYQINNLQRQQLILQEEYDNDIIQMKQLLEREKKLQNILNIFDEIEQIMNEKNNTTNITSKSKNGINMEQFDDDTIHKLLDQLNMVRTTIFKLLQTFTIEERKQLQLSKTLIPTLLGTIIQKIFTMWNPFQQQTSTVEDCKNRSELIIRSILFLNDSGSTTENDDTKYENDDDIQQIRYSILQSYVIPKFQTMYESSYWDPLDDNSNDIGLNLYELLNDILLNHDEPKTTTNNSHSTSTAANNHGDSNVDTEILFTIPEEKIKGHGEILSKLVQKQLVHTVIYNKLLRVLNHSYKPQFDKQHGFNRLDLWIIPWLPYIATDSSLMPSLVADCKRTIKQTISYLYRTIPNDQNNTYIQLCLQVLRPWCSILKKDTLHNIMSTSILSRLAQYVSQCPIDIEQIQNDNYKNYMDVSNHHITIPYNWYTSIQLLFQYHYVGLLTDIELLSLCEGELLPHVCKTIYEYFESSVLKYSNIGNVDNTTPEEASSQKIKSIILKVCKGYTLYKFLLFGGKYPYDDNENNNQLHGIRNKSNDQENDITLSNHLLRNDTKICECFYHIILIIQAFYNKMIPESKESKIDESNDMIFSNTSISFDQLNISLLTQSYRTVLKRRKDSHKQSTLDDLLRMNVSGIGTTMGKDNESINNNNNNSSSDVLDAHVRLRRRKDIDNIRYNTSTPSFRDVVAEFAREKDILFQLRSNSNNNSTTTTTYDGKLIYLFGTIPIYLDQNVAYALVSVSASSSPSTSTHQSENNNTKNTITKNGMKKAWQPMSLNDIAKLAKEMEKPEEES